MAVRITLPDAAIMCFEWRIDWYDLGTDYDVDLEVESDEERASLILYCTATNRLEVSVDGGGFSAIGDDPSTGIDLGYFAAGQRKDITVRYNTSDNIIHESVQLLIDLGVDPVVVAVESSTYHSDSPSYHSEDAGYHGGP